MSRSYLVQRLGSFAATIVIAATLNFLIPRLAPQDPIAALLNRMDSKRGLVDGAEQLVAQYRETLGLNDPLPVQYLKYLENLFLHGDFGYSIAYFPNHAGDLILRAIPWTVGLLAVATLIAFVGGNLLGAIAAWPRTSNVMRRLIYASMPLSVVPYYFLALILLQVFAINLKVLPLGGVFTVGTSRGFDVQSILDLVSHLVLPVLSIALALTGFWALSMRGSMATVLGQPHLTYARAKGLRDRRVFVRYGMRNAMLPQWTALALEVGSIITGGLIAEIVFSYPGVGMVLFTALRTADYFVIQGVVMFVILGVATATLAIDLLYPLLDPRIRLQ
jgi:peptide/nickel transport system permease protein